ncbi:MAG: D-alanyl-D-alanine carboxypeptidase/D-alanyl-D-alanine-endopeptidase, partial [Actinobacteria bacterium]|nr:D-alanyl-D-alanine carboxypeptidase/D-alanyl-D-alanine-endopeptidase [Actinomycetota bacterium]
MLRRASALVLALTLAWAIAAGAATAASDVERALVQSLAGPGLSLERSGAIAVDLQTGEPLFSHRPDVPFIPASNEKLAVTFAALALLGPEFRFRTDVIGVGRRQGPAWVGDL